MKIKYGTNDRNIDVTQLCLQSLLKNNTIIIPSGDVNRANIFSDPAFGQKKYIIIDDGKIVNEFGSEQIIHIDVGIQNLRTKYKSND